MSFQDLSDMTLMSILVKKAKFVLLFNVPLQLMFKIAFIWVILILLPENTHSQTQCPQTISFLNTNFQCIYSVTYSSTDSCTQTLFKACLVINLTKNIVQSADKAICDSYCCTDPESEISLCVKPQKNISITLVVGVLSIILGVFGTIICICKFKQVCCEDCQFDCLRRQNTVSNNNLQICSTNETQIDFQNFDGRQWVQSEEELGNLECSVCLSDKSNFMLPCKHLFHKKCILECMKRKIQCILCRREDIFSYRLYCSDCFRAYKKVWYYDLIKLGDEQNLSCKKCSNKLRDNQFLQ